MGISPHFDLLTRLPRHLKLRNVAASSAPAGRGRISSRSNHDADGFPRKFLVWTALAAAFFAGFAPFPAASETPALRPWTEAAPSSFSLDDLRGAPRDLQGFKGNVVLLHFFATWCEPCVREITSLQKLTSIARDKSLKIIAIDDEKKVPERMQMARVGGAITIDMNDEYVYDRLMDLTKGRGPDRCPCRRLAQPRRGADS